MRDMVFQKNTLVITPEMVNSVSDERCAELIKWLSDKTFLCGSFAEAVKHVNGLLSEPESNRYNEHVFFVFCAKLPNSTFKNFKKQCRRLSSRGIHVHYWRTHNVLKDFPSESNILSVLFDAAMIVEKEGYLRGSKNAT